MKSGIVACASLLCLLTACSRTEQMKTGYSQRCVSCHGVTGRGDGPIAALLPVAVPDFRKTVEEKNVVEIRQAIVKGQGMMPAFGPVLTQVEIQDMVRAVRLLSREGRRVEWWERFETIVYAHCNLPWEYVLGYERQDGNPKN